MLTLQLAFMYLIGILSGITFRSWILTSDTRQEIDKALDSSGIRRGEYLALVRKVEILEKKV